MKILIVGFSDSAGGAAIAANRLNDCLNQNNIDTKFLVLDKRLNTPTIVGVNSYVSRLIVLFSRVESRLIKFFYFRKSSNRFSASLITMKIINRIIDNHDPDIIHFHWVQQGMISINDIARIKKPIVWSLHDVWPFVGGCHYNEDCLNFREGCGNCRVLGSQRLNDISRYLFRSKMKSYSTHGNITFVGLSKWIANLAEQSPLTNKRVVNIPNPIDTSVYRPMPFDDLSFLSELKLSGNKILVGAMSLRVRRKGFNEFLDSVEFISNDVDIITFGTPSTTCYTAKRRIVNAGIISNTANMIRLYSAVSVTALPSLEENLSNIIMESLACGTPVVAFNIGGNSDLIIHKVNGYLATPFDVKDFAQGIDWILNNADEMKLSENSVDIVRKVFDYSVVANQYKNLYQQVLNK